MDKNFEDDLVKTIEGGQARLDDIMNTIKSHHGEDAARAVFVVNATMLLMKSLENSVVGMSGMPSLAAEFLNKMCVETMSDMSAEMFRNCVKPEFREGGARHKEQADEAVRIVKLSKQALDIQARVGGEMNSIIARSFQKRSQ